MCRYIAECKHTIAIHGAKIYCKPSLQSRDDNVGVKNSSS